MLRKKVMFFTVVLLLALSVTGQETKEQQCYALIVGAMQGPYFGLTPLAQTLTLETVWDDALAYNHYTLLGQTRYIDPIIPYKTYAFGEQTRYVSYLGKQDLPPLSEYQIDFIYDEEGNFAACSFSWLQATGATALADISNSNAAASGFIPLDADRYRIEDDPNNVFLALFTHEVLPSINQHDYLAEYRSINFVPLDNYDVLRNQFNIYESKSVEREYSLSVPQKIYQNALLYVILTLDVIALAGFLYYAKKK